MEQIEVQHLTFSYEDEQTPTLRDVSFSVPKGKITLLIGESGCGKTTLLRHLKSDFVPKGNRSGQVLFQGQAIEDLSPRQQASKIGFVRQNVDASYVTDKVWHELAFGLEGLGYSQAVMQRKVAEMTAFFGLEKIYHMSMDALSGGQKQMVNLASVMAMEPELLVLDEPTSQLDPIAANDFLEMIRKINRELGTTIFMTEHRLEEVYSSCDQVLVMDRGEMILQGTADYVAKELFMQKHRMCKALPAATRLYFALDKNALNTDMDTAFVPLNVGTGSVWMEQFLGQSAKMSELDSTKSGNVKGRDYSLQAEELWFRYEKKGEDIVKGASISLERGKITAILGGNGTGKSTFLNMLAGCEKPYDGNYKMPKERVLHMPQNPQAMFAKKTVLEELGNRENSEVQRVIEQFGLGELLTKHPYDLSGGEMQKLALAKLILGNADILLLDEPGKGMDFAAKEEMGGFLKQLAQEGKTVLLVSHDVEFCAAFADYCGLFFDGHIVSMDTAKEFFCQNVFYTTAVRRILKKKLQKAVTLKDVLEYFQVEEMKLNEREFGQKKRDNDRDEDQNASDKDGHLSNKQDNNQKTEEGTKQTYSPKQKGNKLGKWISILILLVVMPITIYIGQTFLHQRKYYFISMLLVLEAICMFWLRFEKRKPKVREIMLIANLCALTAVGRGAFYMLPSVKPVAAMVIIVAACLGGEIGFMVGSFAMLISNIFFGQGPWTPWQMFAMGAVGYFAGLVFRQDAPVTLKRKIGMCVYGFLSILIIYGGIMNPASVIMYQENVNASMLLASCVAGFPFDVTHGISTVIFLFFGAGILSEKLNRVKKKYMI